MIKKYVVQPVYVTAVQWTGFNAEELAVFCPSATFLASTKPSAVRVTPDCYIDSVDGPLKLCVAPSAFIIKDHDGNFHCCDHIKFAASFTEVKE